MSINVRGGARNRRFVMETFSFVDVLFVLDPPVVERGLVNGDDGGRELFSFCVGSGVEVWVRRGCVGFFSVVGHSEWCASIGFWRGGEELVLSGVYIRPARPRAVFTQAINSIPPSTTIIGDLNSRHKDWCTTQNSYSGWLREWADQSLMLVIRPDGPTFMGISVIDLYLTMEDVRCEYKDAGLQHSAILLRTVAQTPPDMERRRPTSRRIDMTELNRDLDKLVGRDDGELWNGLTDIMGDATMIQTQGTAVQFLEPGTGKVTERHQKAETGLWARPGKQGELQPCPRCVPETYQQKN